MLKKTLVGAALWASLACWAGVDINAATEAELDSIKGLGPSSTGRILAARKQGPFTDWQDVMRRVPGVRSALAAKLSAAGLTVAGMAYVQRAAVEPNAAASSAVGTPKP